MKLGIDIGRVIMKPDTDEAAPVFLLGTDEQALGTPPNEGMFPAVTALTHLFERRVWLISKCGVRIQDRTRKWLNHHRFFERTGIPPGNLRFCLRRPEKASHCVELGVTHFIDDRMDVLEAMRGFVPNLFLFGPQRENQRAPQGVHPVKDWSDTLRVIQNNIQ